MISFCSFHRVQERPGRTELVELVSNTELLCHARVLIVTTRCTREMCLQWQEQVFTGIPDHFVIKYVYIHIFKTKAASPDNSDAELAELEEEDEEPEQKTAYQKLLSTLSQPNCNDQSEEEESTDEEEEEEELLDEGTFQTH